jgi:hypothetical protein
VRRVAVADRFLDERFHFAMDWELWLRLSRSSTLHRINRVLAIDRDQPGRKINTWQAVLDADRQRLAADYGIRLDPWYQRLGGFYELALRLMPPHAVAASPAWARLRYQALGIQEEAIALRRALRAAEVERRLRYPRVRAYTHIGPAGVRVMFTDN